MSHTTDPTPDPTGHTPDQPSPPVPASPNPDDVFALPDLADLDLATMSDPKIPPVPGQGHSAPSEVGMVPPVDEGNTIPVPDLPASSGSAVSFDLPAVPEAEGTIGMALADLPEWPLPPPPVEHHLGVEPVDAGNDFPVAEFLPAVEPQSSILSAEVPVGELIPAAEPVSDEWLPVADSVPLGEGIPAMDASASSLFGSTVPTAEPVSAVGEAGDIANLEEISPVVPGSGWLDSQAGDQPIPPEIRSSSPGGPAFDEPRAAELAQPSPSHPDDLGSNIFGGGLVPTAEPADLSDVISATMTRAATPITPRPPVPHPRPSDVALTFDQPPGGSTTTDPAASADLPVAEELPEASDLIFTADDAEGPLDSAQLAQTPGIQEGTDFGATPVGGADASSILADLTHPQAAPQDSSAIRLESPGIDATLSNDQESGGFEQSPAGYAQLWTDPDAKPRPTPGSDSADSDDWLEQQNSGSDLFADARSGPTFELTPEVGTVDPFEDDLSPDQPSLSSAPSSIFSGGPPLAGDASGGSLPIASEADGTDAVEFSDHPDAEAVSSGNLLPSPAGWVDFEQAEDSSRPDVTSRSPIPPDGSDSDKWISISELSNPSKKSPTGKEGEINWGGADKLDPTTEQASPIAKPIPSLLHPSAISGLHQSTQDIDLDELFDAAGEPVQPASGTNPPVQPGTGPIPTLPKTPGKSAPASKRPPGTKSDPSVVVGTGLHQSTQDVDFDELFDEAGSGSGPKLASENRSPDQPDTASVPSPPKPTPGKKSPVPKRPIDSTSDWSTSSDQLGGTEPADYEALTGPKSDPSVVVDYLADSSTASPLAGSDPRMAAAPKSKKDRTDPSRTHSGAGDSGSVNRRAAAGVAVGLLLGVGSMAGVYFSGVLDPTPAGITKPSGPQPNTTGQPGPSGNPATPPGAGGAVGPGTVADARTALDAGQPGAAITRLEAIGATTPEAKAALGKARFFARLKELPLATVTVPADDAELKKARADLEAVATDPEATKTPEGEKAAVQSILLLGLTHELAGDPDKAREVYADGVKKFPKAAGAFETALDRLKAIGPDAGKTSLRLTPADAQQLAIASVMLLVMADPPGGPAEDAPEAGRFFWKAVNAATAGKYTDAVELITKAKAAHIARARALAGRGLNPLSDPLEQIFPRCCDDLTAFWKLRASLYDHPGVGELFKKDVTKALDQLAKMTVELKEMNDKLATDLKKAEEKAQTLALEYKAKVTSMEKLAEANGEIVRRDRAAERKKIDELSTQVEDLTKQKRDLETTVSAIAKDLQEAKLLDEKYDTAKLLGASKMVAKLTTSDRLELANRLNKAEAELEKANAKYLAAELKLKADHAAVLKKVGELNTAAAEKLREAHAADLKSLGEKYALERRKLEETYTTAVKLLEDSLAVERNTVATAEKRFKADLANAISPAQALDLWLPVLADLRRPADADPAIEAANKVLKTATPGSEDEAKALTVKGLALFLKGDLEGAKKVLDAARETVAYKNAKGKGWAKAADVGVASIGDPVAGARVPVETGPRKDLDAAARSLDAGIAAYKAGRYTDAEKALAQAAWNNPADAISWYFLGATRWASGKPDQAKDDFRQGAEREQTRSTPARVIDIAISPIQGPVRDALTAARP